MKPTKKAQIELGYQIKQFCNGKFGSQQRACKVLNIKQNALSMVVNGHRAPSAQLEHSLLSLGFEQEHFQKYYNNTEPDLTTLTTKQLIEFAYLQKDLLDKQAEVIKILMKKK